MEFRAKELQILIYKFLYTFSFAMTQNVSHTKLKRILEKVNVTITGGVFVLHIKWVKAYTYITIIHTGYI